MLFRVSRLHHDRETKPPDDRGFARRKPSERRSAMTLRTNRGRPCEVSLIECPFPECGKTISDTESYARHWPHCAANPANGGKGGFPSDREEANMEADR